MFKKHKKRFLTGWWKSVRAAYNNRCPSHV